MKIVETMCYKKIRFNMLIVDKFCKKKHTYNIGGLEYRHMFTCKIPSHIMVFIIESVHVK